MELRREKPGISFSAERGRKHRKKKIRKKFKKNHEEGKYLEENPFYLIILITFIDERFSFSDKSERVVCELFCECIWGVRFQYIKFSIVSH